jgi:hypothetical protein
VEARRNGARFSAGKEADRSLRRNDRSEKRGGFDGVYNSVAVEARRVAGRHPDDRSEKS